MKKSAVAHKGGCCSKCDYNRCVAALEFHHVDPEQKEFTIASKHGYRWETLEPELEKCDLLCANCHREAEDKFAQERRAQDTRERPIAQVRVEKRRREVALKAVALMGGRCQACGYDGCVRLRWVRARPGISPLGSRAQGPGDWQRQHASLGSHPGRAAEVRATVRQLPP